MESEKLPTKPEAVVLDALLEGHTTARDINQFTKIPLREVIKILGHPMFSAGFEALTLQAARTAYIATSIKALFAIIQNSLNDDSKIKAIDKLGQLVYQQTEQEPIGVSRTQTFKGLE